MLFYSPLPFPIGGKPSVPETAAKKSGELNADSSGTVPGSRRPLFTFIATCPQKQAILLPLVKPKKETGLGDMSNLPNPYSQ